MTTTNKEIGFNFFCPPDTLCKTVSVLVGNKDVFSWRVAYSFADSRVFVKGRTRSGDVCLAEHLAEELGDEFAQQTVITFHSLESGNIKRIWGIRPAAIKESKKPLFDA